jgi:hypothetical protein
VTAIAFNPVRVGAPRRPRQLASALAAATLLAVPTCGSDDPVTRIAGIPVLEGHTSGPNTELGGGFSVVDGSLLLGVPMPPRASYGANPPPLHGWRALLLVTGDAGAVFTAFAHQAARAGFVFDETNDGFCRQEDEVLTCDAYASEGPYEHRRELQLGLRRGQPGPERRPVSHMSIEYSVTGTPPPTAGPPERCECGVADRGVEVPDDWPALPGEGQPFEDSLPHQDAMDVEPGSRPVAHPVPLRGLWSSALFLVTDEPEEVLDRYERQLDPHDRFERRQRVAGGSRLHRFWGHGGGTYTADLLIRPGGPDYLLIEHSPHD